MTDTERVVLRLKRLIKAAHNENYDFVYIPVGTAKLIVRLLEEDPAHGKATDGTDAQGAQRTEPDRPEAKEGKAWTK
jgi:hypothetical protein